MGADEFSMNIFNITGFEIKIFLFFKKTGIVIVMYKTDILAFTFTNGGEVFSSANFLTSDFRYPPNGKIACES